MRSLSVCLPHCFCHCIQLFSLLLSTAQAATPRTFVATVKRVSDGDAITAITSNGTKLCTRLLGIEAPQVSHAKRLN
jgi:endonuclease YncB( thermonuclease family)